MRYQQLSRKSAKFWSSAKGFKGASMPFVFENMILSYMLGVMSHHFQVITDDLDMCPKLEGGFGSMCIVRNAAHMKSRSKKLWAKHQQKNGKTLAKPLKP